MSDDFLSRVRAEALRRIEAERFEAAVKVEKKKIQHEKVEKKKIQHEKLRKTRDEEFRKYHAERRIRIQTRLSGLILSDETADLIMILNCEDQISGIALGELELSQCGCGAAYMEKRYSYLQMKFLTDPAMFNPKRLKCISPF